MNLGPHNAFGCSSWYPMVLTIARNCEAGRESHSDPVKLKEAAQDAQHLSTTDLRNRQLELKEAMEHLKTPSDAQLIQIAIANLNNSSLSLEDHRQALEELLILVEIIDNANDMNRFGGLPAVIRELDNSDQEMRIISAWTLGKASQNNPIFQKQVLDLGALSKLMKLVNSSSVEEATKGLYAISALIRNNIDGQHLFSAEAGERMLQNLMSSSSVDIRLKKKSASLVADLAVCQLENKLKAGSLFLNNRFFLKSVVDLTTSDDIDLQEKALIAVKSLLQLKGIDAQDLRDFCRLDKALENMGVQLQQQMTMDDTGGFLLDIENLRKEVELIFERKLEKDESEL
ncbi:Arm repeat superfamily protein [Thalictrum thalictroides]|uniref:Arm repeat superfamily protein n=1 Tax=Thalictrum thalictroides TaxID=46969 RepID=A0A7J6WKB4_THATH|nr:Arm repeat superfamily protein [Thalictrum thalictroides]